MSNDALEFIDQFLTEDEKAESDFRVALVGEFIKARNEQGISQKKLEELTGIKQPVISRIERGTTTPQIDTLLKLLAPLGKTLSIVPMNKA